MKILHVVVGLDPVLGGPPAVALRLASAQAGQGHTVRLAAHDAPSRREQIEKSVQAVPGINRVEIRALDPVVRIGWFISSSARRQLHDAISDADVVHLHGLWEPLIRTAAIDAHARRKPYLLTPHGMLDPWSLAQRRMKKRLALALVFRRVLNNAACLHLLNDDEARLLAPLGLTAPTIVVPNGIFIEEIDPLPGAGAFRRTHAELQDHPFILFLSRLHHKKGLDILAAAFAMVAGEMPDLQLVIAGPDEGARSDFEQRVRDSGLDRRVHVIGPIWGRDKYAAMVDATCFCLPSRQEGFSMAITEALACRLPVVISENCHFPEVAEHRAGVVTTLDAARIADGLRTVLADSARGRAMGESGRRLVQERFTWPTIAQRMVSAYQKATAKSV